MVEEWRKVEGFESYEVSNLGRVKSLKYGKERILKQGFPKNGYAIVVLSIKSITTSKTVHGLVANSFLNHKPNGFKMVIDHIDDNPLNNRVDNLQIITHRNNVYKTQGKYSSKFKGVCYYKQTGKWISQITINGKLKFLGLFECELQASEAYQNKLKSL